VYDVLAALVESVGQSEVLLRREAKSRGRGGGRERETLGGCWGPGGAVKEAGEHYLALLLPIE
jgi:hypothetical protein